MINYQVTVKEAMKRGKWPVKLVPLFFLIGGVLGGIILLAVAGLPSGFVLIGAGILGGIIIGHHNTLQWKQWALEHVRDIHRLYYVAEREQYITNPDGWWNRKLLGMSAQGRAVREMEIQRLHREDRLYETQIGTPQPIEFGYSKATFYVGIPIVLVLGFCLISGFLEFNTFGIIIVIIGAGVMLFSMFDLWQKMSKNPFMVRLDTEGITLEDNPLIPWNSVVNCYSERRGSGKYAKYYFIVLHQNGNMEEIEVGEMQGSAADLDDAAAEFIAWSKQKTR